MNDSVLDFKELVALTRNNGCIVDEILTDDFKSTFNKYFKEKFLEKYSNVISKYEKFNIDPLLDAYCDYNKKCDELYQKADSAAFRYFWIVLALFIPLVIWVHPLFVVVGFCSALALASGWFAWYQSKELKKLDKTRLSRSFEGYLISQIEYLTNQSFRFLEQDLYSAGAVGPSELREKSEKYIAKTFNDVDSSLKYTIKKAFNYLLER